MRLSTLVRSALVAVVVGWAPSVLKAQDSSVHLFVAACEGGAAPGALLELLSTELETSGYSLARSSPAQWSLLVTGPCGDIAAAHVRVLDAAGRVRADADVPLAGAPMPERTVAIWATELLRSASTSPPPGETTQGIEQLRLQLTTALATARAVEQQSIGVLEQRAAELEERATHLDDRATMMAERVATIERERAEESLRARRSAASSHAALFLGASGFDGSLAFAGDAGVQLALASNISVFGSARMRFAEQDGELGRIRLLTFGVQLGVLHWLRLSDEVVWGLGPSIEGGASVGWGEPNSAVIRTQTVWQGHAALSALSELAWEFDLARIGLRAEVGYLAFGVEAMESGRRLASLRGLFFELGIAVGFMFDPPAS